MVKLLCFLHFYVVFGACQFIRTPSNTALIVGQRLEMVCLPNSTYTVREWRNQKPSGSPSQIIYSNWSQPRIVNSTRFGYDIENNNSIILYLNSTELYDAGNYNCSVQLGTKQPDHYSAQLIVFETDPVCEDSMISSYNDTLEEGSIVRMRCSLNFSGSLTPTMEWRQHGGDLEMDENGRVITDMVETVVNPDTSISSTLTMSLNSTYNTTFYSCKTYFQWDNTSTLTSTATNIPDYTYTWNSSVIIIFAKPFVREETTPPASTPVIVTTKNGSSSTFNPFNAIYLVAGVAILFGLASSLVAVLLCLRLRRKNSAAMALKNSTEQMQSEYDLIPYAVTDGYDTIEEVKEEDDILMLHFAPRHGPLPSPGYSALMPDEPKPPGVYSRMEDKKKSFDDKENDVDENEQKANPDKSKPDYSELTDVEDSTGKTTLRIHSYLDLETENGKDDNATEGEDIPSAYLKITEEPLQSNVNIKVLETIQEDDSSGKTEYSPNCYLPLIRKTHKDIVEDSEEIPSAYLKITDEISQSTINNNAIEPVQDYQIPSSYLTTRDMKS